ncbi:MAG: DUF1934 domain-containing protein [Ruminococcaceae bacterium]|nr:DUF1934 domain-containing protein [Oscillospiraceae bacterium]
MIEINKNQEINVSLKIKTLVVDPEELDGIDEEIVSILERIIEDDLSCMEELEAVLGDQAREEMELCTEAVLRINADGCVEIEYLENEDDEQMRAISRIIFHPQSPALVSMTKEGAVRTFLSFEEGKTHICTYDTPFMPLKIYVESRAVDNRLLECGSLHLNYVLNFQNDTPRHFVVDIDMKETANGELYGISAIKE